ncbi:MAG: hypothetical protein KAG66_15250 [Methylococcales bacterium]|nr:hypothetical protein [Methylococcales bacterium]
MAGRFAALKTVHLFWLVCSTALYRTFNCACYWQNWQTPLQITACHSLIKQHGLPARRAAQTPIKGVRLNLNILRIYGATAALPDNGWKNER